ncbi:MAG TPA: hypothetical protein VFG62_26020 [Rhodopila sp.]|jgi:hypothetical protein|nr:hypothetical protein [Rhodopila sp.]
MGTRAQFFIGDPQDIQGRVWLGTVGWDGYPDGDMAPLADCSTEQRFREVLNDIVSKRRDYCDPNTNDFPFPWKDDLFLTDCTYAFRDGAVYFNYFHSRPMPMAEYLGMTEEQLEAYREGGDFLPRNVLAPLNVGAPPGPDSIMFITESR